MDNHRKLISQKLECTTICGCHTIYPHYYGSPMSQGFPGLVLLQISIMHVASYLMHHCYVQQAIVRAHNNVTRLHWCHPCLFQQVQTLLPLITDSCFSFSFIVFVRYGVSNKDTALHELYRLLHALFSMCMTHRRCTVH